jgi:hypothetical protein
MPSPFGAQAMPLGQLFTDPNFIHVPSYQRSFAWTREEAGRLLDDVAEALDASDTDQGGDYFLGPMLFIKPAPPTGRIATWKASRTGRVHDVVDGLQRLTTLTILFCVLRDLDAEGGESVSERLLATIGTSARVRLALREPEETFFQAHVRRRGATAVQPAEGNLSLSEARVFEVREHMRQTLAEWDVTQRHQLVDFLLDKCHIVLVSATGIDRAHRMFTVLNATGRPLARNDILKASLLGAVPGAAALNRATTTWDAAQARLGADFDNLFSHIRTIHRRTSAPIIAGIQEIAAEQGGAEAFVTRLLGPAAAAFEDIRKARHAGSPHSAAIAASLRHLGWLRGGDWVPPALLWWLESGEEPAELAWFLGELDRLAYALRIMGMGTKRRGTRLGNLLQAMRNGDDLKAPASPLRLTRDEQSTFRHNLRDLHARSAPMAKLVLLRLNEQMAGGPLSLPVDDLTVEHLLPRKPAPSSRWREWYPDPAERGQCTESLGNLVLMTRAQNDKAGNHDFARKQDVLLKGGGTTLSLPINDYVRGQTEWRAAQVREREAELMRLFAHMWDMTLPGFRPADAAGKAPPLRETTEVTAGG